MSKAQLHPQHLYHCTADWNSGWAVSEGGRRRGFAEDMRLNCELAVTAVFDTVRWLMRRTLRVPQERESPAMRGLLGSVPPGPEGMLFCVPFASGWGATHFAGLCLECRVD